MPTPRPAKKSRPGWRSHRTRTMIVATAPQEDREQALGHGCRHVDTHLPQRDDEDDEDPEEEDDLPGRSRVPARDRHLHALSRPGVPPGERRHGEHDAGEQPDPVADPAALAQVESPRMSRSGNAIGGTGWSIAQSESHPYTPTRGTADTVRRAPTTSLSSITRRSGIPSGSSERAARPGPSAASAPGAPASGFGSY